MSDHVRRTNLESTIRFFVLEEKQKRLFLLEHAAFLFETERDMPKENAMKKVASPLTIEPTADIVVFIIFPAPFPRRLIPHLIAWCKYNQFPNFFNRYFA